MKHQNKFNSQEQQQHTEQHAQQKAAVEFNSVDDMLRYDAEQTPTPPAIASRLRESLGDAPAPPGPWWRRIFRK